MAIARRGRPAGFAYIAVVGQAEPSWWISSMSVAPDVDREGSVAALASVLALAAGRGIGTLGMVSHATRLIGSCAINASRIESEIWSAILSG